MEKEKLETKQKLGAVRRFINTLSRSNKQDIPESSKQKPPEGSKPDDAPPHMGKQKLETDRELIMDPSYSDKPDELHAFYYQQLEAFYNKKYGKDGKRRLEKGVKSKLTPDELSEATIILPNKLWSKSVEKLYDDIIVKQIEDVAVDDSAKKVQEPLEPEQPDLWDVWFVGSAVPLGLKFV